MLMVFEDKMVITRSEYEEYVQLKYFRKTLDELSKTKKYFDSGEIRKALGLNAVEEEKHAEYIYASFLQDYGMDLVREQGKLHWKQFVALFQGLTSRTKIKEIMRIRVMDVPESNGHNQKEIQNIMELKSYYALPVEGGGGQSGLNALFAALEAEAMR